MLGLVIIELSFRVSTWETLWWLTGCYLLPKPAALKFEARPATWTTPWAIIDPWTGCRSSKSVAVLKWGCAAVEGGSATVVAWLSSIFIMSACFLAERMGSSKLDSLWMAIFLVTELFFLLDLFVLLALFIEPRLFVRLPSISLLLWLTRFEWRVPAWCIFLLTACRWSYSFSEFLRLGDRLLLRGSYPTFPLL